MIHHDSCRASQLLAHAVIRPLLLSSPHPGFSNNGDMPRPPAMPLDRGPVAAFRPIANSSGAASPPW